MNHLVVADWQDEFLVIGIEHGEGDLAVVVRAIHRVALNELQRIVHPAHVPLESKTQATGVSGGAYAGKCGGFLGNHHDAWVSAVGGCVCFLQELNRVEVLSAAINIR